ncbi:hypothetical protein [Tenacibaculum maritimum]|uniref:hypothetical protein n=1 Tax=Tenacibaculum maritimum TaxID=107401 RepID=UPI0012E4269A|nr:hypothetical protein JIP32914_240008 [Tenacibaculum maritimum]
MSFTTSEKPVQLHTLEKGTRFVKSFRGLPCSKIYRLGISYPYASFSLFLCENIHTFNSELFPYSCLVFPISYPKKYPSFNDLVASKSLSFDLKSFQFLRDYFNSLPFDYLQSVEGSAFFEEYLHFLSSFKNNLLDIINLQNSLLKFLNNKFSNRS